jgi:CRP-like cAMP-binding protein
MDRASGEACVLFMPLLLNELFRVLCTREKSAQRKLAFLGIVHVVQRYRHRLQSLLGH